MLTVTEGARLTELRARFDKLSHRETLVLHKVCEHGMINKRIARELDCSERTVESIRKRLFDKFGVTSAVALGVAYGELKTLERLERGAAPTEEPATC